ncbi:cell division protein FtsL [Aestuariispira ectoiniformans]|uniref:cell division protein FtsL n=1 Tax=Aestuariispira ectoiniformans TaxID=2775080 RepID=UPI00223AC3D9|nr:hypothetical protein [Aestuariispira ectoiniformans]
MTKFFGLIMWTTAAAITAYALFYVSYRVEGMEDQLAQINHQILKEQETIHVLQAEWSYLNNPDRLQKLTDQLMPEMQPLNASQFVSLDSIPFRPVEAGGDGTATADSKEPRPDYFRAAAHRPGEEP